MQDYISLGSTPCDEDCAQVGTEGYEHRAWTECIVFRDMIRRIFGQEPDGASLASKRFSHDFGSYFEVVCYYETDKPLSLAYALKVESECPTTWDQVARERLQGP